MVCQRRMKVVFEDRPLKYCFGVKNYGEVIGTLNTADAILLMCSHPGTDADSL